MCFCWNDKEARISVLGNIRGSGLQVPQRMYCIAGCSGVFSMPLDYSKWKTIEVSDDEDDTHPNIDTPSLFRWRHQARLERMAERKQEKEKLMEEKSNAEKRILVTRCSAGSPFARWDLIGIILERKSSLFHDLRQKDEFILFLSFRSFRTGVFQVI